VIYDKIDFHILKKFYDAAIDKKNKETTIFAMAKEYPWEDKPVHFKSGREAHSFYTLKVGIIYYRIKKMVEEGFIEVVREGKKIKMFSLLGDKVQIARHRFPDGYHLAIIIKEKDRWVIFQL